MNRFRPVTRAMVITLTALTMAAAGFAPVPAEPSTPTYPGDLEAAFERLKTLVGTWDEDDEGEGWGRVVEYHLTGRGTALIEEFSGDPPMATLYHLDGPDLRLTHYCNAGNQPRMRAASYDPDTGTLAFEFVDVTNLSAPNAYHTRELTIRFINDDHIVLRFVGLKNGEEVPGDVSLRRRVEEAIATTHSLARRTETESPRQVSEVPVEEETSRLGNLDPEAVFDRLKETLVGEWVGRLVEIDSPVEATFYLTGNESALVEDIRRPDKPASRMHTVYHLADEELRLTHYCSYGNQPRLVATSLGDDGRTIEFELLDVTNLSRSGDRYTHKMRVSITDRDHVSVTYVGVDEGYEGELTAELTRVRAVVTQAETAADHQVESADDYRAGTADGQAEPVDDYQAEPADDYQAAWEQLKKLSGTWDSYLVDEEGREAVISYHVTGGSRVVYEEFLGDTPDGVRDMATAYHLDVDDLVATHYCGAGNQPRMRAASWDPDTKVLRFDFWDITDLADPDAYYTTNIELYFADDDNVELRFRGTSAGVQEDWQVHRLRRLTSRPYEKESRD